MLLCTGAERAVRKGCVSARHLGWDHEGLVSGQGRCVLPHEARQKQPWKGLRRLPGDFGLHRRFITAPRRGGQCCGHPTLPLCCPKTPGLGAVPAAAALAALPFPSGCVCHSSLLTLSFTDRFCFPSRLPSQTDCLVCLPRASTSL